MLQIANMTRTVTKPVLCFKVETSSEFHSVFQFDRCQYCASSIHLVENDSNMTEMQLDVLFASACPQPAQLRMQQISSNRHVATLQTNMQCRSG
jgi:hypothetical protein